MENLKVKVTEQKTVAVRNKSGKSKAQFIKKLQETHSNADDVGRCLNVSINQLIGNYITEKNAKNEAYYFILQSGYLEKFKEYCEKK